MVAVRPLTINQGGPFAPVFTWKINGMPVDLSVGWKARFTIWSLAGEVLHALTTENGGVTLGGVAGTIAPYISDDDTLLITWLRGAYLLEMIQPDTVVLPKLRGPITVRWRRPV